MDRCERHPRHHGAWRILAPQKVFIRTLTKFALPTAISVLLVAGFLALHTTEKPVGLRTVDHTPVAPSIVPQESYRGLPVRLRIPSIGVDTGIEYTGLSTAGDMIAPASHGNAAWYKYGSIPGEEGSAVIAGHVAGPKGEPAVFANLNKLRAGDLLHVVDAKNEIANFTVKEVRTYSQQDQHNEVFNSASGIHLNIITCAGKWDSAQRNYLERLVVFADKSPGS